MNFVQSDLLKGVEFIDHAFFNRTGGESISEPFRSLNTGFKRGDDDRLVLKNREKIAEHFGVGLAELVTLNQKHGDTIHIIDESNIDKYKFKNIEQAMQNEGDAIITNQKGLLIGVNTADCAPVLFCDQNVKYIAAIHAGWRGALKTTILENTIKILKDFGCGNILASIGPTMLQRYFAVEEDVASLVDPKYLLEYKGQTLFDMQHLVLEKLKQSGAKLVSKLNIDTMGNDDYFSHRRQAGVSGVQFSGIMIKE